MEESLIRRIVEAALWAPSPHNSQPWQVFNLTTPTKVGVSQVMAGRLRADLGKAGIDSIEIERLVSRSQLRIESAPNALLVGTIDAGLKLTGRDREDLLARQMAVQSVGTFLQSLFLIAADAGIGTCWLAAPMYCPGELRELLQTGPDWTPQALVLLGQAEDSGRTRPRRPVDEVLVTL